MSFKKFFKNISKKFNKKQKENTFSNWDLFQKEENKNTNWSTCSINKIVNFLESPILNIEQDKQFIKTSNYIFFTIKIQL